MTTSAVRSIGAALNLAGARAAFEAMPRSHGLVTMGSAVGGAGATSSDYLAILPTASPPQPVSLIPGFATRLPIVNTLHNAQRSKTDRAWPVWRTWMGTGAAPLPIRDR